MVLRAYYEDITHYRTIHCLEEMHGWGLAGCTCSNKQGSTCLLGGGVGGAAGGAQGARRKYYHFSLLRRGWLLNVEHAVERGGGVARSSRKEQVVLPGGGVPLIEMLLTSFLAIYAQPILSGGRRKSSILKKSTVFASIFGGSCKKNHFLGGSTILNYVEKTYVSTPCATVEVGVA